MEIKRCGSIVKDGVIHIAKQMSIVEGRVEYKENGGRCILTVNAKETVTEKVKHPSTRNRSFSCAWEGDSIGPDAEREILMVAAQEFCDYFKLYFTVPKKYSIVTSNFRFMCRAARVREDKQN